MGSIRNSINKMNRELRNYKNSLNHNQSLIDEVEGVLLPAIITIGGTSNFFNIPSSDWNDDNQLGKKPLKNYKKNKLKTRNSETLLPYTPSELERLQKEAVHRLNVKKTDERLFNMNKYKEYKKRAINAYKTRKIFTIYGRFKPIRLALEHRGWIEKLQQDHLKPFQSLSQHSLLLHAKCNNDYEKVSLSRLVQNYPAFFIWQPKQMLDTYGYLYPYRNRIRCGSNLDYATKIGLLGCTENAHWNTISYVSELKYPPFFRLDNKKSHKEFQQVFRIMQCLSLINFILYITNDNKYILYDYERGTVSMDIIDFAFKNIEDFIKVRKCKIDVSSCESISKPTNLLENATEDENWKYFISTSRKIINKTCIFKMKIDDFLNIYDKCATVFEEAKEIWPTLHMDGFNNLWILKPGSQARGKGIVILKDYKKIIDYAVAQSKLKYIVQKYVELPLLIYRTKFDIRQFILITITDTINIWMYKNCYLRFSSQNFTLADLSEAVHLTNHSVQKKYRNGNRSARLPVYNMWSLSEFQQYLKNLDCSDVWESVVYTGMKQNVISVVLSSIEELDIVQNSFEVYGCDFILDEHFEPFLLEINASPDVSSSTPVTKKICKTMLDDVIKVVVDLPENKNALTGDFELIYQIDYQKIQPKGSLVLQGDKI